MFQGLKEFIACLCTFEFNLNVLTFWGGIVKQFYDKTFIALENSQLVHFY